MVNGYYNRVNAQWQQTRFFSYIMALTVTKEEDRQEIYDWLPLPGDPTKKERFEILNAERQQLIDEQRAFNESLRAEKAKQ